MNLKLMGRVTFLKKLARARAAVAREISANAAGGHIAAGLAAEGYASGYRQALDDVAAMLEHGHPSDPRGYWR